MNGDNKKKLESDSSSSPSLWSRLRSALGHVGLFLTLMIYTAVGGMVSNAFERLPRKQCFLYLIFVVFFFPRYAWLGQYRKNVRPHISAAKLGTLGKYTLVAFHILFCSISVVYFYQHKIEKLPVFIATILRARRLRN